MTPSKTPKTFDCIAFKRQAQSEIYEATQLMSHEEQLEYFRKRAEEGALGEWWKSIKCRQSAPPAIHDTRQ